jgi:DNA-binding NarL/FixJ family response regulator
MREQLGASIEGWERPAYERGLAVAQSALSPEAFASAWSAGETMSQDDVVAEALTGTTGPVEAKPEPTALAELAAREREVLELLARGQSDREIAVTLHISPRTVGGHVTNLLAKLGVPSRTSAATLAVRYGIA